MTPPTTNELLRSADGGPAAPDHERIVSRGRRLTAYRAASRVAGTLAAVAVLAGAAMLATDAPTTGVPLIGDPPLPQDDTASTEPTPDGGNGHSGDGGSEAGEGVDSRLAPTNGPSQSAADAERDGIHPEIAARSFADRVDVDRAWIGVGSPRIVTDEGVWVVSRIPVDTLFDDEDDRWPLVGDRDGRYGLDLIDPVFYGEVLLLDHEETRIVRAFPFPDFGPQHLVATDGAVYCLRQGDGALPDSLLCRIDRGTFEWRARIFPLADGDRWFLDHDEYYLPEFWTVDASDVGAVLGELRIVDGVLVTVGNGGQRRVDPDTLEVIGPLEPAATAQDP